MSVVVFPYPVIRPYSYPPHHSTTRQELNNGNNVVRAELPSYGQYRVKLRIRLPDSTGTYTNETWQAFLRSRQGAKDPFLFKDRLTALFHTQTLEAVGTGDGVTTALPLDMVYVDASTLLVYKDGVLKALTSDYTFSGNNSAPVITFNSAPANGVVITATYDFYMPVLFAVDPPQGTYLGGAANFGEIDVELVEVSPGAHRVSL